MFPTHQHSDQAESRKGIPIGAGGQMNKSIGSRRGHSIERELTSPVHHELSVVFAGAVAPTRACSTGSGLAGGPRAARYGTPAMKSQVQSVFRNEPMLPLSFSSSADGRIELTGPEPDSVSRLMNLKVGIPQQLSVIVNGGSFVVSIIAL